MKLSWQALRDYHSSSGYSLVQILSERGQKLPTLGAEIHQLESSLGSWSGHARSMADATFAGNYEYATQAGSLAATLARSLNSYVNDRVHLRDLISNIIEDGAHMRFTFSDEGDISDFYGSTGLWTELSPPDKASYLTLLEQLPQRILDVLEQGEKLDSEMTSALNAAAQLTVPPALSPDNTSATDVGAPLFLRDQGMSIFRTGDGDDIVRVSTNRNGGLNVTVNGKTRELSKYDSENVLIQTQGGNDRVTVDPDVAVRVRIDLGDGDDFIDDQAIGGSYIDAGSGNDAILLGGGHNTVYLGSGTNKVTGSTGLDYINGGSGRNTINAGSGNSVLYGGTGNSTINSGSGKNTIYAGSGTTSVNNRGGDDTVYAQAGTEVHEGTGSTHVVTIQPLEIPDAITVQGSPEFQRRIQDDLEILASSPDGQKMLSGLGNSGHTLLIDDGTLLNNGKVLYNNGFTAPAIGDTIAPGSNRDFFYDMHNDRPGAGTDAIISIDTTLTTLGDPVVGDRPDYHELNPTVVLFHEMAHAYDDMNGTMMPGDYGPNGEDRIDSQTFGWNQHLANAEREAVGLSVDWDGNPRTPEILVPDHVHPHDLTENSLREEMGLPDREHYLR